ncbi:ABC transporter permease [Acidiphilium sp.]|uniref:ABC transporter permease n=1 Tax=Acidiphilium sp. TaxID=527 RepID=UPI00258D4059|nr:ABC transporter permease [Acidiphilium sp.]
MGERLRGREPAPDTSGIGPASPAPSLARRGIDILLLPWVSVLIALVAISALLSLATPYFFTEDNIIGTVAVYFSWICIAGFGEALVMIGGGLDLSVGSTMGLAGMISAMVLAAGGNLALALLAGLATGAAVGLANGLVITRIGLNPFITTLGSLSVVRGLAFGIGQGMAVTAPSDAAGNAFSALGTGTALGIPVPVLVMLGFGVIAHVVLTGTPFGRHVYGLGGNEQASRLLGLNVDRLKIRLYVISGVLAAIGGMLLTAKSGTALPDAATGYELKVIAAVIIGGTSLAGGRGTIPGVLIGAALLGVINDGIVLLGLAGYWQQLITGLVIVAAAAIDILRRRLERVRIA